MSAETLALLQKLDLLLIDIDHAGLMEKPAKMRKAVHMTRQVLEVMASQQAAQEAKINVILRGLSLNGKS